MYSLLVIHYDKDVFKTNPITSGTILSAQRLLDGERDSLHYIVRIRLPLLNNFLFRKIIYYGVCEIKWEEHDTI